MSVMTVEFESRETGMRRLAVLLARLERARSRRHWAGVALRGCSSIALGALAGIALGGPDWRVITLVSAFCVFEILAAWFGS